MGTNKRRSAKPPPQLRSRTTRSRGKALENPVDNTQQLTEQLRALGLYAAPTLGDGNCLFRALSDQLYGTPSYHARLRKEICDWIEAHKERYEPFVDDERGLDVHLQCMRQQATYGGHLELSAFAHMTKRNVKIIQPGLVYVIEWDAGDESRIAVDDVEPSSVADASSTDLSPRSVALQDSNVGEGDKKLTRRERKRAERDKSVQPDSVITTEDGESVPLGPIYVAYHDWEHFSSVRNLRGPHAGLPYVREVSIADDDFVEQAPVTKKRPPSKSFSKPPAKARTRAERRRGSVAPVPTTVIESPSIVLTPSQVPLPDSRSPSPMPESIASATPPAYPLPPSSLPARLYRSPKRTFDESSASSESSQSLAKRVRGTSVAPPDSTASNLSAHRSIDEDEGGVDTPALTFSAPGSPTSSMSSLSTLSSRAPTPPPQTVQAARPLTRRERKKLGLPKQRTVRASAGTIIIPGGKYKRRAPSVVATATEKGKETDTEEWIQNGTGREDVRGFRELRI